MLAIQPSFTFIAQCVRTSDALPLIFPLPLPLLPANDCELLTTKLPKEIKTNQATNGALEMMQKLRHRLKKKDSECPTSLLLPPLNPSVFGYCLQIQFEVPTAVGTERQQHSWQHIRQVSGEENHDNK